MEIERKFLINSISDIVGIDLNKCLKKRIIQDYLYWDKLSIVRVRCIESDVVKKFVYTVKTGKKFFC